jgi:hypothetical protein
MDPRDVLLGLGAFFLVLWVIYIAASICEKRRDRNRRQ